MRPTADLSLYWRVVLINGVVFILGTVALALSPATVSTRVLRSEAVVLAVGLVLSASFTGFVGSWDRWWRPWEAWTPGSLFIREGSNEILALPV